MEKRSTLRAWLATAGTVLVMQLASAASASCIYNRTPDRLDINLSCGWVCSNEWHFSPSETKCRGSTGGLVTVFGGVPTHGTIADEVFIHVDDHGYVIVTPGHDGKPIYDTVCSYRQDHSQRECQALLAPNGGF
ncbi:hypothetical protein [Deinococcus arenicola]|uniref:Secreted protein n=1 Tax=Deinococcus arenicola TaxID=2994950 RepID=A0ABU4DTB4_9DEIO|nr:hypothetical protein [Deinococcus sp. ZS9-10]MDV6375125.1 hypothetical protein [Deinococcus sp. ZS9-10]